MGELKAAGGPEKVGSASRVFRGSGLAEAGSNGWARGHKSRVQNRVGNRLGRISLLGFLRENWRFKIKDRLKSESTWRFIHNDHSRGSSPRCAPGRIPRAGNFAKNFAE